MWRGKKENVGMTEMEREKERERERERERETEREREGRIRSAGEAREKCKPANY